LLEKRRQGARPDGKPGFSPLRALPVPVGRRKDEETHTPACKPARREYRDDCSDDHLPEVEDEPVL